MWTVLHPVLSHERPISHSHRTLLPLLLSKIWPHLSSIWPFSTFDLRPILGSALTRPASRRRIFPEREVASLVYSVLRRFSPCGCSSNLFSSWKSKAREQSVSIDFHQLPRCGQICPHRRRARAFRAFNWRPILSCSQALLCTGDRKIEKKSEKKGRK